MWINRSFAVHRRASTAKERSPASREGSSTGLRMSSTSRAAPSQPGHLRALLTRQTISSSPLSKQIGGAHEYETVAAGERGGFCRDRRAGISRPRRTPVGPVPADGFGVASGSRDAANDVDILGGIPGVCAILRADIREGLRERQARLWPGVSLWPVCRSHAVRDERLWLVRDSANPACARVLLVLGNSGGIHRRGYCGGFGLPRLISAYAAFRRRRGSRLNCDL